MGVKVGVSQGPELYPTGDYLLQIMGSNLVKESNKVRISFIVVRSDSTGEQFKGRQINRNYNQVISPLSDLGKTMIAAGIDLDAFKAGTQVDLDVINGRYVWASNGHYTVPATGATINSLSNFRKADQVAPVAQPQAAAPAQPQAAAAPAQQAAPVAQPPAAAPQGAPPGQGGKQIDF